MCLFATERAREHKFRTKAHAENDQRLKEHLPKGFATVLISKFRMLPSKKVSYAMT
jgi:hypothetical protein